MGNIISNYNFSILLESAKPIFSPLIFIFSLYLVAEVVCRLTSFDFRKHITVLFSSLLAGYFWAAKPASTASIILILLSFVILYDFRRFIQRVFYNFGDSSLLAKLFNAFGLKPSQIEDSQEDIRSKNAKIQFVIGAISFMIFSNYFRASIFQGY